VLPAIAAPAPPAWKPTVVTSVGCGADPTGLPSRSTGEVFLSLLLRDLYSETALNLHSTYFVCRFLSRKRKEGKAKKRGENPWSSELRG